MQVRTVQLVAQGPNAASGLLPGHHFGHCSGDSGHSLPDSPPSFTFWFLPVLGAERAGVLQLKGARLHGLYVWQGREQGCPSDGEWVWVVAGAAREAVCPCIVWRGRGDEGIQAVCMVWRLAGVGCPPEGEDTGVEGEDTGVEGELPGLQV